MWWRTRKCGKANTTRETHPCDLEKLEVDKDNNDSSQSDVAEDLELDELDDTVIWTSRRAREDLEYKRHLLVEVNEERLEPGVIVVSEENVRAVFVALSASRGVGITPESGLRISF